MHLHPSSATARRFCRFALAALVIACSSARGDDEPADPNTAVAEVDRLIAASLEHDEYERMDQAQKSAQAAFELAHAQLGPESRAFRRAAIQLINANGTRLLLENNLDQTATLMARAADELAQYAQAGPDIPADDPVRVDYELVQIRLSAQRGEFDAALQKAQALTTLTSRNPAANRSRHVEGLTWQHALLMQLQRWQWQDGAKLVAEAGSLLPAEHPAHTAAQQLVLETHVFQNLYQRAVQQLQEGASTGEVIQQLAREIGDAEADLAAAGVEPAIAQVPRIALAQFQLEQQDFAGAQGTMSSLALPTASVAHIFRIRYWNTAALLDQEWGNYAAARASLYKARDNALLAGQGAALAVILNNLALCSRKLGDFDAAWQYLLDAQQLYEHFPNLKSLPMVIHFKINFGKVQEKRDDAFFEAQEQFREALQLVRTLAPPDAAYAECNALASLGINHYNSGEFAEAQQRLLEARERAVDEWGPRHLHVAEIDVNLGWVALAVGDLPAARSRFESAVDVVEHEVDYGTVHPRFAEMKSYLARVLARQGERDAAAEHLEQALAAREEFVDRMFLAALTQRDFLAFVQELRVHGESFAWPGVLDTYLELADDVGIPTAEQYDHLLKWKGIVNRRVPRQALSMQAASEDELRRRDRLVSELRQAYFRRDQRRQAALLREIESLDREVAASSQGPVEAAELDAQVDSQAVAAALPKRSAFLDVVEIRTFQQHGELQFVEEHREYVAFLLRRGHQPQRIDFGPAASLNDDIRAFRESIERGDAGYRELSEKLSARVRAPLLPLLADARLLIVAGDGTLATLPFAALPGAEEGAFWVEDLAISTIASADSIVEWLRQGDAQPSGPSILAIGGVEYGEALRDVWQPLPGTAREATQVIDTFRREFPGAASEVTHLAGGAAHEKATLEQIPSRRFIHLATHGFFLQRQAAEAFDLPSLIAQLDSGIVLADPPAADDDGYDAFLTAEEIGRLDLYRCDLVVLSACETALGYARAGQGLIGLVAAFDRAGARSIVSSLWRIGDESTQLLMVDFYNHLWQDRFGPAEALRQSQLDMIRRGRAAANAAADSHDHPRHWAAFVLTGNPGAVGE